MCFKWANCTVCELYVNKAVLNKFYLKIDILFVLGKINANEISSLTYLNGKISRFENTFGKAVRMHTFSYLTGKNAKKAQP